MTRTQTTYASSDPMKEVHTIDIIINTHNVMLSYFYKQTCRHKQNERHYCLSVLGMLYLLDQQLFGNVKQYVTKPNM